MCPICTGKVAREDIVQAPGHNAFGRLYAARAAPTILFSRENTFEDVDYRWNQLLEVLSLLTLVLVLAE